MATHSSILAWRIPRTEEPGKLLSMGSQRVGHDWATNTHTHTHTYTPRSIIITHFCRTTRSYIFYIMYLFFFMLSQKEKKKEKEEIKN